MALVRRYADAVMFNGEALIDVHGGRQSLRLPTFVYLPPVDADRFVPSRRGASRVREELGVAPDALVVGTVSNLVPMKGLETFVAAAGEVAAARAGVRFVVVGATLEAHRSYSERIRSLAAELDLPHPIVFAGDHAAIESWYAAMDVHVTPSWSEGTTTTALEAQSCGVPVVATKVGALHEVVEHGVTGLLVPPERAGALAAAIVTLLNDPARRAEMGRAGRAAALERFTADTSADVHARAYEAALAHATTRQSRSG